MFSFFKTPDIQHPTLGVLKWQRGHWRGFITLQGLGPVPLAIAGSSRAGPDAEAVAQAIAAPANLASLSGTLKRALYEHYEPYAEAADQETPHPEDGTLPMVASPDDALAKAKPAAVVVAALDGRVATEVCYSVPWDEEHTLGARFSGPQWIELCGSTLVP